jgi:hypothetical protein
VESLSRRSHARRGPKSSASGAPSTSQSVQAEDDSSPSSPRPSSRSPVSTRVVRTWRRRGSLAGTWKPVASAVTVVAADAVRRCRSQHTRHRPLMSGRRRKGREGLEVIVRLGDESSDDEWRVVDAPVAARRLTWRFVRTCVDAVIFASLCGCASSASLGEGAMPRILRGRSTIGTAPPRGDEGAAQRARQQANERPRVEF